MDIKTALALAGLFCAWVSCSQDPAKPKECTLKKSISQYGITWAFKKKVPVGQFVNGDYYVVGPVTVSDISPRPENGRHGSVVNPLINKKAGFDNRIGMRFKGGLFDADQYRTPPIDLKPGDALISSISADKALPRMLRPSDKSPCPIKTAAILTCLEKAAPADAFRPGYCDPDNIIYRANDLKQELLPNLKKVNKTPDLKKWERVFQRPWLDFTFDAFTMPVDNGPQYGREYANAVGIASLLLCLDFTPQEKEKLLVNFVQVGIDLWGIIKAGKPGWEAHGGHGNGRKWPIILSGVLLGIEGMQRPQKKYPKVQFSEDMQTMYDKGWTGANVVYAGHVGKEGRTDRPGWGAYEHLPPGQWESNLGESYRRCCTSHAWVGEALAARLLNLREVWNHDAFFDYVDRWMTEDDTEHLKEIKKARGASYSEDYQRQRQTWEPFVQQMWDTYR